MIDFYTWNTPNGWKVAATLEELGLEYTVKPIDISTGIQKEPEFLAINPNGRIPAIVDHANNGFKIFESGAIMMYLAEKAGRLIPGDEKGRYEVLQWLMFQVGGLGPMQGQAHVFQHYFPEQLPSVIERYKNETSRLYAVLETRLEDRDFLVADQLTIADLAHWSWARIHSFAGLEIDEFPNMQRWLNAIEQRPAIIRALNIPLKNTNSNQEKQVA